MRQMLNKICPKIDPKFKLKFEGPILEIFGDFGANLEHNQNIFKFLYGSAEGGRPAKGRGKLKLSPLGLN